MVSYNLAVCPTEAKKCFRDTTIETKELNMMHGMLLAMSGYIMAKR